MSRRALTLVVLLTLVVSAGAEGKPPPNIPDTPAPTEKPEGTAVMLGRFRNTDAALGHTGRVSAVAWSPDGKHILTGSWDNGARIWDVATGKEVHRLDGHTAVVFGVAFSPDGKLVATASRDKAVRLWDSATGKEVRQLVGHTNDVFGVTFSPDGKQIATGSFDASARVWETATGKEVRRFESAHPGITAVLFTPDGKTLVGGSQTNSLYIWDLEKGKEPRRCDGHTGYIYPIAITQDGRTVATGSYDSSIRMWEVATGKERRRIEQTGDIYAMTMTADGKTIFSTSGRDKAIHLWEAATGKERGKLEGHDNSIFRLALSPDGRRLASASEDHTVLVWNLKPEPKAGATAVKLKPEELEALWVDLGSEDGNRAFDAINRLSASPSTAVEFLSGRLKPTIAWTEKVDVPHLIEQLDDDDFDTRERASAALEKLGQAAIPHLRREYEGKPTPEVRRRIEALLKKLGGDRTSAELRALRVVEVLEGAGGEEARKALEEIVKQASTPEAVSEARAALMRMKAERP
jgi:dipeptidyl aminopeptidase/acylaminoacyl peptidase